MTSPAPAPMASARDAARDATPIVVGYATLGLAAGMLLAAEGLAWWWAPVWSVVIYSGTMQMLLVPLAGAGAPLGAIAASTLFVSGRHVFYGLGFPLDRVRGRAPARLYAVHAITDEVYALLSSKDRRAMSGRYVLTVEIISHSAWVTGTTAGALAGRWLADAIGERIGLLGFVLTALFVVLAIENWRAHPDAAALCVGLVAGAVGLAVSGSAALLSALGVLALGLSGLYAVRRRRAPGAGGRGGGQGLDHGGAGRPGPEATGRDAADPGMADPDGGE
ncbi:branched-chain amino acid transport protein [Actinomyces sp. Chiba101]|uniref:AzlC family ABC transporter permease n=1 Tax=Actinomyces TaxID=1654 RepID=UPI000974E85F|nr:MULTISPECIES: AzlC family ABC transporter permease [Actinomyces]BAW92112.1 branched-chain amino acid transport protein [Actinomyces sp. Chiba101]GAV94955.1 branched-chain amino acid transport protein [Actinomyces denticolens]SUU11262.1 Inner membrane protein YgaZ [Actinomyces denticolens]